MAEREMSFRDAGCFQDHLVALQGRQMLFDGSIAPVGRGPIGPGDILQYPLVKGSADHRGQLQSMPHLFGKAIDAGTEQSLDVIRYDDRIVS